MSIDFKRVVVPLTVGIVCIFAFRSYFSQENQVDKQINIPSAIGTKEDPHARARYEWNRLRSPVTGTIPQKIRSRELAFAKSIPSKESAIRQGLNKSANPFASQVFEWERVGPFNLGGRTRAGCSMCPILLKEHFLPAEYRVECGATIIYCKIWK